jgi:hypothetical protein
LGTLLTGFEPLRADRDVEGAAEIRAQVVQSLRREVSGLLLEERFDVTRPDVDQPSPAQLRADDVLSDRADALSVRGSLGEKLVDPPLDHLIDRAAAVLRWALVEAMPRAILGDLDLSLQLGCPPLGLRVADLVLPPTGGVLVLQVPAIPSKVWLCHLDLLYSLSASVRGRIDRTLPPRSA